MSSWHVPYIPLNIQIRLLCPSSFIHIISCLFWNHGIHFSIFVRTFSLSPRQSYEATLVIMAITRQRRNRLCLLWDIVHVAFKRWIATLIHLGREIHICVRDLHPNPVTLWILKIKQNLYTKWFRMYGVTWQPSSIGVNVLPHQCRS